MTVVFNGVSVWGCSALVGVSPVKAMLFVFQTNLARKTAEIFVCRESKQLMRNGYWAAVITISGAND
jgi:hypothetical protein